MVVGAVRLLKTNRRTSANQVAAAISKSKRFDLFYFTQLTFHQTEHFKMFYNVLELPTSKRPPHKPKQDPQTQRCFARLPWRPAWPPASSRAPRSYLIHRTSFIALPHGQNARMTTVLQNERHIIPQIVFCFSESLPSAAREDVRRMGESESSVNLFRGMSTAEQGVRWHGVSATLVSCAPRRGGGGF